MPEYGQTRQAMMPGSGERRRYLLPWSPATYAQAPRGVRACLRCRCQRRDLCAMLCKRACLRHVTCTRWPCLSQWRMRGVHKVFFDRALEDRFPSIGTHTIALPVRPVKRGQSRREESNLQVPFYISEWASCMEGMRGDATRGRLGGGFAGRSSRTVAAPASLHATDRGPEARHQLRTIQNNCSTVGVLDRGV
jgi:hypothetical protein